MSNQNNPISKVEMDAFISKLSYKYGLGAYPIMAALILEIGDFYDAKHEEILKKLVLLEEKSYTHQTYHVIDQKGINAFVKVTKKPLLLTSIALLALSSLFILSFSYFKYLDKKYLLDAQDELYLYADLVNYNKGIVQLSKHGIYYFESKCTISKKTKEAELLVDERRFVFNQENKRMYIPLGTHRPDHPKLP